MGSLFNDSYSRESVTVSVYGSFVGIDDVALLHLTVDGGEEEFTVGDTVSGAAGDGVVYSITGLDGVWDGVTATGTCVLTLTDVNGTFSNDEAITGAISGIAVADGTGTVGVLYPDPTEVYGAGIESVAGSGVDGTAGEYVVTVKTQFPGLLTLKHCVLTSDTADDWQVLVVSEDVDDARTVTIQVFKGGTATMLETTERLYLEFVMASSTALPRSY